MSLRSRYLEYPTLQAGSVDEVEHRPWTLPREDWRMGQSWLDLLFAHWPVDPAIMRSLVPDELELHLHDDRAWLGITPFQLQALRLRGLLPSPVAESFPEINVRTYVSVAGRPGIYFFSLDTSSAVAVAAARAAYRLPYRHSRIRFSWPREPFRFRATRSFADGRIELEYEGSAELATQAVPGSLEHFLTERYRLYTVQERRVWAADIHHRPWLLRPARATVDQLDFVPKGLVLEGGPIAHLAEPQHVLIWPLRRV